MSSSPWGHTESYMTRCLTLSLPPNVEKRECSYTVAGMSVGTATVENSMEVPQKTRVAVRPSNPTPGRISRQSCNSERFMHPRAHSSIIHSSPDVGTAQVSTDSE